MISQNCPNTQYGSHLKKELPKESLAFLHMNLSAPSEQGLCKGLENIAFIKRFIIPFLRPAVVKLTFSSTQKLLKLFLISHT